MSLHAVQEYQTRLKAKLAAQKDRLAQKIKSKRQARRKRIKAAYL